jgi:hypothetical protein
MKPEVIITWRLEGVGPVVSIRRERKMERVGHSAPELFIRLATSHTCFKPKIAHRPHCYTLTNRRSRAVPIALDVQCHDCLLYVSILSLFRTPFRCLLFSKNPLHSAYASLATCRSAGIYRFWAYCKCGWGVGKMMGKVVNMRRHFVCCAFLVHESGRNISASIS